MIHSVDGMNISPRNDTSRIGPKIRNGHACRCMRFAIVSKMIGVTICAPLSQPVPGRAVPACRGWRGSRRGMHWSKNMRCCCCRRSGRAATPPDFSNPATSARRSRRLHRPRESRLSGSTEKNTGAISSAGTAQATRSSRQLPPTSGSTTGMVKTVAEHRAHQHAAGIGDGAERDVARQPFAHQGRHRRLHDGDAEAGGDRRRRKASRRRPRRRARRRPAPRSPCRGSPRGSVPIRAISSDPGTAAMANKRQRQPDQQPDLGLRHVQLVVHLRDHRRHGENRHAHGDAGKPEHEHESDEAADRKAVPACGRGHGKETRRGPATCISGGDGARNASHGWFGLARAATHLAR